MCAQSCPTVCKPMDLAHQAPLSMGFLSNNTGVGCHFLLLGIFPTQGSACLHWQADSLPLAPHNIYNLYYVCNTQKSIM